MPKIASENEREVIIASITELRLTNSFAGGAVSSIPRVACGNDGIRFGQNSNCDDSAKAMIMLEQALNRLRFALNLVR